MSYNCAKIQQILLCHMWDPSLISPGFIIDMLLNLFVSYNMTFSKIGAPQVAIYTAKNEQPVDG